jgi:TonB family protein
MTFQALLFCPDEKTARVTTQVLSELEFTIDLCSEPFAAVKKLMGQHFDAVVVDCENEQNASLLFKSARNSSSNQSALAVAVVEGQAGVANAFRIGANLVLTKPINVEQAKGTLRVARGLLRKGTDSGAKQAPAPPPPQAPPPVRTATPPAAARSTPAAPPAPKPVFSNPPSIKPKAAAAMARTTVDPGNVFDVEQEPTPLPDPAEEVLLESMEEHSPAPSQKSRPVAGKATGSKEQLWQAISRPGTPLQRSHEPNSKKNAPIPMADGQSLMAPVSRGPAGAAAAPAPARESQFPPIEATSAFGRSSASAPIAAPTFAALEGDETPTGNSKKIVFVGIAAIVLVAAGYFGYTKLHKRTASIQPAQVAPQSAPQNAIPPAEAAVPPTDTASTLAEDPRPDSASLTHAPAKGASTESEQAAEEADIPVTHPGATKSLVVKSNGAPRADQPAQETAKVEEVPLPALGSMTNTDPSALSSIVQPPTVAVPKVVAPQMLRVSQGVTQGLVLKRVQPNYPRQALQMRIQGAVQLQAVITKTGSISSVKVLSGDPLLARAAVDAVNQWKYKPYFLDGEPVDIQTQITVNFRLP